MKALRNSFLILIVALAFAGIGYKVRRSQAIVAIPTDTPLQPTTAHGAAMELPKSRSNSATIFPLVSKLEQDLAMSEGVTRWLRWLEALEGATLADFPHLMELSRDNADMNKLLVLRWAEIAPRDFFDWLVGQSRQGTRHDWETLQTLFSTWARNDREGMVAAVDGLGTFGGRTEWRMPAVNALMDTDVELGLQMMQRWNVENYTPGLNELAKWAAADPRHAFDFVLAHQSGSVSRSAIKTIGKEWAKQDPTAALAYAREKGGDWSMTLANSALGEWVRRDTGEAAKWMAAADPSTRNNLSGDFLEAWANNDLAAALGWAQTNLSGTMLNRGVAAAIRGAAEKDVAAAAEIVGLMQDSPAQAQAAGAVARKWFPHFQQQKPPGEAVAWLAKLEGESLKRAVSEVTWSWSESDPEGMAAFLASGGDYSSWIYSAVGRSLTRKNPSAAIQWSEQLPANVGHEVAGDVFSDWRRIQPSAALEWLRELPEDDGRRIQFFKKAIEEWAKDPRTTEQFAAFAELNKPVAEHLVKSLDLADERRIALLRVIRPDEDHRNR
jgi:hypothetical protein